MLDAKGEDTADPAEVSVETRRRQFPEGILNLLFGQRGDFARMKPDHFVFGVA